MEGEEGGGGGVRRASTREDIRRKLANFGDEQEEQRKTTEELSLNNNLEVGGVPHEILFGLEFRISSVICSSKLNLLLLSLKRVLCDCSYVAMFFVFFRRV